jgi:CheY-like chemotaxis protein
VVEDTEQVRNVVTRWLRGSGYHVLEAHNGDQALDLCRHRQGPIDVLVTDVKLPNLSGAELYDHLEPMAPGLQVLYLSGFAEDLLAGQGLLPPGAAFLQKPFPLNLLTDKVVELLERSPRGARSQPEAPTPA